MPLFASLDWGLCPYASTWSPRLSFLSDFGHDPNAVVLLVTLLTAIYALMAVLIFSRRFFTHSSVWGRQFESQDYSGWTVPTDDTAPDGSASRTLH